jgi:hypothetical protein
MSMVRRAKVVATLDTAEARARSEVTAAVAAVAFVMGVDGAAALLDLTRAEVRRSVKEAEGMPTV